MAGRRGEWLAYYLSELDPDNPRIRRFAKRLKIKPKEASGIYGAVLGYMWKHQRDGDLTRVEAEDLEYAAEWDGKEGEMHREFLDIFNDLLWAETWEERVRFYRGGEVKREVDRERQAAFRATKKIEGEPAREPRDERDAKLDDAKPDDDPNVSQNLSQPLSRHTDRPTEKTTDRKTEPTEQQRRELADAVKEVGQGGSFSKKAKARHPAFHAVERCALSLGLNEREAARFTAWAQAETLKKSPSGTNLRLSWIVDSIALLLFAIDRKDVVDKCAYVECCKYFARDKWVARATKLFDAEFEKHDVTKEDT